ncbi:ABC transporter ATP-binding protein [uncultured Thiodictyon sp.]|uniref:ATP-binding cassette domain-containing protein n=1 Tax=uncultured Thiodictyon sp. TaxID=1846217 RepID=UPI0025E2223F|nr:ABC transporter ATP-binding protein [uncultured Thiodictyon sp.]
MTAALELTGVFQHVGQRCALAGIDLRVPEGAWLLLVGRNGAGKSLLTRLILGLDTPSAGGVRILGQDLQSLDSRALATLRRRLGVVLQGGSLLEDRSVIENLVLPLRGRLGGRPQMARAARLVIASLRLDGLENLLPRSLSLGQRRQVELARALIHRPDLLVWDGLSDGLDPAAIFDTLAVLRAQRVNRPLTLIATDNRADALGDGCDQVGVLERGRLIFHGPPKALDAALPQRLDLRYVLTGRP